MDFLILIVIVGVFVIGVLAGMLYFARLLEEKRLLSGSLEYRLLRVTLYNPPETEVKRDWKQEVGITEQLFGAVAEFSMPVVMEIAVSNIGEDIQFYFASQKEESDSLYQQIQSFWPDAVIEKVDDYNIFHPAGGSVVANVLQEKEWVLPIKTYDKMEEDSLLSILGVFSSLAKEGDGIALQVVFKKAASGIFKSCKKVLEEVQKGVSLKEALANVGQESFWRGFAKGFLSALKTIIQGSKTEGEKTEKKKDEPDIVEHISRKISKPLVEANIRIVVSSLNESRATAILNQVGSVFPQFVEPRGNSLKTKILKGKREQRGFYDFAFRYFRRDGRIILNIQELSSIVHLPTKRILDLPKVKKIKARTVSPPLDLPTEGLLLGRSLFRGERKEVYLLREDRFRHLYVIGQTGTGKTTFLKELIRQDIENNDGIAFIDPHGQDVEDILGLIPERRWDDVVYFNPADTRYPTGFNMLEYDRSVPEQRTFIVNELLEIIGKLYNLAETGGPMFEQYFKNALFLLLNDSIITPTIMDVPRVFADAEFRKELLDRCPDPLVVHFWKKEAEKASGDFSLGNVTPYVVSKLNPFIANDYIKPIVGQERSTFDFKEILNNRKIFLVNLSKGLLGETNTFFLGMMITGKIFMHAMARVNLPRESLSDFFFYIDEFQNVTTKTISNILSEARKYRLSLNIAHQYIAQIQEGGVKEAVFGNVGSIVAFRVGPDDADYLKKQFAPVFNEYDLVNIDNFNAYVKLLIRGKTSQPFNIEIYPPSKPNLDTRRKVEELSRIKYTQPREIILEKIYSRYKL